MDKPPDLPHAGKRRPIGLVFFAIVIAPLVLITILFQKGAANLPEWSLSATALFAFVCALIYAQMVSRGPTPKFGLGILTFFGLLALHGVAFFAGCLATLRFN